MKFKFIGKKRGVVKSYDGKEIATGEEIELTGHFAEKALINPDYQVVSEVPVLPEPAPVSPVVKLEVIPENKKPAKKAGK